MTAERVRNPADVFENRIKRKSPKKLGDFFYEKTVRPPLMAHEQIRLVLLYPYPDTVHGSPLHETLRSTFLTERRPSTR